ncbi:MAG: hypothetical protein ACR652_26130 [Methylocystis sp.]|uniref:hypothetical protein n=1 Tax=Methylocystis sp. TaxID=1911079 RepID=UPI003DA5FCA5
MSHPAFLAIGIVTCNAQEDFTGSDELVGIKGDDQFEIGRFSTGETRDVHVNRPILPGVTELTIVEKDYDPDDELIRIDLTQEMDTDRIVGVMVGRARYDIAFKVQSTSD